MQFWGKTFLNIFYLHNERLILMQFINFLNIRIFLLLWCYFNSLWVESQHHVCQFVAFVSKVLFLNYHSVCLFNKKYRQTSEIQSQVPDFCRKTWNTFDFFFILHLCFHSYILSFFGFSFLIPCVSFFQFKYS